MRYLPTAELCGRPGLGLLAGGLWAAVSSAQVMPPQASGWGEMPLEQEGLVVGGVEVLTALIMSLVLLQLLSGGILLRAWNLLHRARLAEGVEVGFLWDLAAKTQRWASWIAYGLLPVAGAFTMVMAPSRTVFGFGLAELALGLFLLGALINCATFFVLEAVRRRLGAERA